MTDYIFVEGTPDYVVPVCEWSTDKDARGVPYWGWNTSCGNRMTEDPTNDKYDFVWKYCPFCGKVVKVTA